MNPPDPAALRWARDHALLGFVTSVVTPLCAEGWVPLDLRGYALHAGLLALVTGLAVGGALHALLWRFPERSRVAVALVVGPVPLGAWGGTVAALAALIDHPGYAALALPCGAVAGGLQGSWWVPAAVWLSHRGLPRWPVALLAGLTSPVLAFLGVFLVLWFLGAW
jgi:hypothetical protein